MPAMKVALLGLPGAGKTTLGRRLAEHFSLPCVDVDDDILEPAWGCSVAASLAHLGDRAFLVAEEEALMAAALPAEGVLCTTGSTPLGERAMQRLQEEGWLLVWLDVDTRDVLARLQLMKVDRVVGQAAGPLETLLEGRLPFYARWHSLRVVAGRGWDLERLQGEVAAALGREDRGGQGCLTSTRAGGLHRLDSALLGGLAPCGGLFLPSASLPRLATSQLERLLGWTYQQVAGLVLSLLIPAGEIPPAEIQQIVNKAYSSFEDPRVVPVTKLEEGLHLAELFHGPSGSFKDLALQLTPQLVARAQGRAGGRSLVLVATSGDTGSAVLEGFGRFGGSEVAVLVLFPTEGISAVQRQQMVTCAGNNVKVVAVRGDFDACQRLVKAMFQEQELAVHLRTAHSARLNTANSINWGRLLPQVAYHFHIYLALVQQGVVSLGEEVDLAVPSGNLGNMVSGLLARSMGLPYGRMVVASNTNNILADFFSSGVYDLRGRSLARTISPAIDILVSSNLERWLRLHLGPDRVAELYEDLATDRVFTLTPSERALVCPDYIQAGWVTEQQCREEVVATLASSGYLLDPHTAVGVAVARRCRTEAPMVVLSTAHYSKFWPDLEPLVLGGTVTRPAPHAGVAACLHRPVLHRTVMEPTKESLVGLIRQFAAEVFPTEV